MPLMPHLGLCKSITVKADTRLHRCRNRRCRPKRGIRCSRLFPISLPCFPLVLDDVLGEKKPFLHRIMCIRDPCMATVECVVVLWMIFAIHIYGFRNPTFVLTFWSRSMSAFFIFLKTACDADISIATICLLLMAYVVIWLEAFEHFERQLRF